MKFAKIGSKVKQFEEQENSNLMKVEIMIQHDGLNKNNSFFKLENIKKAEDSLKNIPILGYIIKDDDESDFDSHNMKTKVVKSDDGYKLEVEYLESPIGVIPSDTEVRYEEINDRTYLICTGYIWSNYCSDAADIINNSDEKKVSMEISVDSYSVDEDGVVDIEDYKFLGLTILGDHVESGMYDTVMTKYSTCANYKEALGEIYSEILKIKEKEDCSLENIVEEKEVVVEETFEEIAEETTEEVVEEVIDTTEETEVEEVIEVEDKQEFALSIENMTNDIRTQLNSRKVKATDYWGDEYERQEFWMCDIIPTENIVVVEDATNYYNYFGIPYAMNGDNLVLDYDNKVAYMQEWRPKNEGETVTVFEREDELKNVVMNKFANKESEIENISGELDKLKEFKAEFDKKELVNKVEEVCEKFNLEADITDVKTKALNGEVDLIQFEKELGYLYALQVIENNKFSNKAEEKIEKIIVNDISNEPKKKPYGGLLG